MSTHLASTFFLRLFAETNPMDFTFRETYQLPLFLQSSRHIFSYSSYIIPLCAIGKSRPLTQRFWHRLNPVLYRLNPIYRVAIAKSATTTLLVLQHQLSSISLQLKLPLILHELPNIRISYHLCARFYRFPVIPS